LRLTAVGLFQEAKLDKDFFSRVGRITLWPLTGAKRFNFSAPEIIVDGLSRNRLSRSLEQDDQLTDCGEFEGFDFVDLGWSHALFLSATTNTSQQLFFP